MGAPLSVVSCETKRTRGGLTSSCSWTDSGILRWPGRKRLRNHFVDELPEFLAETLHREIFLVSLARLLSQLPRERRIFDQTANRDRQGFRGVRGNEKRIIALDQHFHRPT